MQTRLTVFLTVLVTAGAFYVVATQRNNNTDSPIAMFGVDEKKNAGPCDEFATPKVRETLHRLVEWGASDHILSGQSAGHTAYDLKQQHYRTWVRLTKFRNQPAPAIMAIDLGLNEIPENTTVLLQLAKQHTDAGGILTMSMNPRNPWTYGDYQERNHGSFDELLEPGTIANTRWMKTLDKVAAVLGELQDEDITVLWRPLHEANGYWFWWCPGGDDAALTNDQFKQLWKHMYQYLQS